MSSQRTRTSFVRHNALDDSCLFIFFSSTLLTLISLAGDVVSFLQDGLFLVTNCLDLVSGYPLAVLTPNVNEYKRLVQKVLNCEVNDKDGPEQLLSLAKT